MKNNKNKARERKKSSYAYNQIYSGFGYNKKGLASLEILVTTFFVIGLLFLLGALAINNTLKQEELAIVQKDTLNVKNIFSLLNKSLDSTWSLSSVQALYEASESGFEPTVIGNNQILSEFDYGTKAYWYRFHPEKEYTGIKLPSGSGISGVPNRCNNGNPGICLPQAANVENAMRITMEKIWFNLGNKAPYTILDKPVKITIPAKEESQSDSSLDINVINFWPGSDRFFYEIATHVVIDGYKTKMNTYAVSSGYIKTKLGNMIKIGWMAVGLATQLRYVFENSGDEFRYTEDTTGYSYIESSIKNYFKRESYELAEFAGRNGFVADLDTQVNFRVPDTDSFSTEIRKGAGLLMRYDTDVSIIEGEKTVNIGPATSISDDCADIVGTSAAQKYRNYESYISRYISQYGLSKYADSSQMLVAGIITNTQQAGYDTNTQQAGYDTNTQQAGYDTIESNWNPDAQNPVSNARGLMQIMENTAPECSPHGYDDMFDPEKNIRCGIIVLVNKIKRMSSYANSNGDLLRMSLAAYNWGEGNVQSLADKYGKRYSDIEKYLPTEAKKYVNDVMAGYGKWQSCSGSGKPSIIDVTNTIPFTNFAKGRSSRIDSVVIHDTAPCDTALKTYQREGAKISAHYLICADGKIYQLVNDEDRAYHAPPFNERSIGIEHESTSQGWTDAMMTTSNHFTK